MFVKSSHDRSRSPARPLHRASATAEAERRGETTTNRMQRLLSPLAVIITTTVIARTKESHFVEKSCRRQSAVLLSIQRTLVAVVSIDSVIEDARAQIGCRESRIGKDWSSAEPTDNMEVRLGPVPDEPS